MRAAAPAILQGVGKARHGGERRGDALRDRPAVLEVRRPVVLHLCRAGVSAPPPPPAAGRSQTKMNVHAERGAGGRGGAIDITSSAIAASPMCRVPSRGKPVSNLRRKKKPTTARD